MLWKGRVSSLLVSVRHLGPRGDERLLVSGLARPAARRPGSSLVMLLASVVGVLLVFGLISGICYGICKGVCEQRGGAPGGKQSDEAVGVFADAGSDDDDDELADEENGSNPAPLRWGVTNRGPNVSSDLLAPGCRRALGGLD